MTAKNFKFVASIVIPAYNEQDNIVSTLSLLDQLEIGTLEVLIIVDSFQDKTIEPVESFHSAKNHIAVLVQDISLGPAGAIKFGMNNAKSDCVVVMMADGSDDVNDIPKMVTKLESGASVVCASRYMKGGQQIGGWWLKKSLSRTAGLILKHLGQIGTYDPTNSFKGYSKEFLSSVEIESSHGFEMGLELVSKAKRLNFVINEFPTTWIDRLNGESRFKLFRWIGSYLHWFLHALLPRKKSLTRSGNEVSS